MQFCPKSLNRVLRKSGLETPPTMYEIGCSVIVLIFLNASTLCVCQMLQIVFERRVSTIYIKYINTYNNVCQIYFQKYFPAQSITHPQDFLSLLCRDYLAVPVAVLEGSLSPLIFTARTWNP